MGRLRRWTPLAASLVLLLGLGAFGLWLVTTSRHSAEATLRATTVEKQATVAALTGQYLQLATKEAFEFGASQDFAFEAGDPGDQAILQELLAKRGGFFNYGAVLAELDGRPLSIAAPPTGLPLADDPGYAALRSALLTGQPGVSSLMHADGDIPLVAVGVPVLEGDAPAALLVAYFRADTSHLQRYSEQLGRGSEAIGMVVDDLGSVVAARDIALVGQAAPRSPARDGARTGDGGAAEFTRDGVAMVTAWAPVGSTGWSLVEERPAAAFYASVRGQSQDAQIALLALLVAGAAAVTILNHRTDQARRRGEQRCEALVQDASDVITVLDADGTITYASPALERILGYPPEERLGTSALGLVHPDDVTRVTAAVTAVRATPGDRQRLHARALRHDGSSCPCEIVISNLMHQPGVEGIVVSMHDTTELTRLHDELRHRATHDQLTALPNRAELRSTVGSVIDAAATGDEVAALFLDLDGFKSVNDRFGHDVGDALLVQVAERLRTCLRDGDTVGRIGGDEFVMVVHGRDARDAAQHVADRALAALHESFTVDGQAVEVGVSIGIAVDGPDGAPEELLRRADAAMYRAKHRGRGCWVFAEDADLELTDDVDLELSDDDRVPSGA